MDDGRYSYVKGGVTERGAAATLELGFWARDLNVPRERMAAR